jgi:hypothetical protein
LGGSEVAGADCVGRSRLHLSRSGRHAQGDRAPRTQREEFFIGDTVGFTDKHLSERVGIIVRLNAKTASIAVNDTDGHWHVSYALLRKIVDI